MKKNLFFLFLASIAITAFGQNSIPNGNFETWNTATYDYPQNYPFTSNTSAFFRAHLPFNLVKATPGYNGSTYAVQLTTNSSVTDTNMSYFLNANPNNGDPSTWTGGMPYTQKPTGIRGYYKYNVATADSATIIVVFSKAGSNIGTYIFKIGGIYSSYTLFNFNFSPALPSVPDEVIFAAASSNIMVNERGVAGSILIIDSVSFTGVSSQPALMNGDFELWQSQSLNYPVNWNSDSEENGFNRTTDRKVGDYAMQLTTSLGENNGTPKAHSGKISNGYWDNSCGCMKGGNLFSNQIDTLAFWYKYSPQASDSAQINLNFIYHGSQVWGNGIKLPASANYQYVEIPFNIPQPIDTVIIQIQSSLWNDTLVSSVGSDLKIDEIHFKSQPLHTGILNFENDKGISIFPNPSNGKFLIQDLGYGILNFEIYNITGEKVYTMSNFKQKSSIEIDLSNSPKGIYFIKIYDGQKMRTKKIVLQ